MLSMTPPQCLKLIILRITMMPTPIQIDAARQHQIAGLFGEQQRDVGGRGEIDDAHHAGGSEPMIIGRGLGFRRHRLDLAFQALAVAQHAGKIAQRFGQIAARLGLDGHHDGEKAHFRRWAWLSYIRLRPCSRVTPTFRPSTRLGEFAAHRIGRLRAPRCAAPRWWEGPTCTERTMTSMALANSSVNFFARRAVRKPSTQRGRPKPDGERRQRRSPAASGAVTRQTTPATSAPERRR